MAQLTSRLVLQHQDYVSPYDESTLGFEERWWIGEFVRLRRQQDIPYFFTDEAGDEVARALLRKQAGFVDTDDAGVAFPDDAIAVDFLEVRADLIRPRQGIGTSVVRSIEQMHPEHTLYAFSEEADEFWRSTGWTFVPRLDGRTSYRPLFALWR